MNILKPETFGKNDEITRSKDVEVLEETKKTIQEYTIGGIRMNLVDIKHI